MDDVIQNASFIKPAAHDGLVVLRCDPSRSLAKMVQPDGTVERCPFGKLFDAAEVPVPDLDALHCILLGANDQYRMCVVRGALASGDRATGIRRLTYPDFETGDQATLQDVPRSWVALDLDGVELPPDIDRKDVAACARAAIPQLPPSFHGKACVAQATASHTIKPGARMHLWFWLGRPATCADIKTWLKRAKAPVDLSLYQPQSIHYTAAPILPHGWDDPVPHRLVMLLGDPHVPVPPAVALAPPVRPPGGPATLARPMDLRRLGGILRRVVAAEKGTRHNILLWAACRMGEAIERGDLDEHTATELLTEAIKPYGLDSTQHAAALATIKSGIAKGRCESVSVFEGEVA